MADAALAGATVPYGPPSPADFSRERAPASAYPVIGHVLDSVAGFFANAADAQDAMRQLAATQLLQPSQLLLLAPENASWVSFNLHSRQWSHRAQEDYQPWFGDVWLVGSLGGLLAGLVSATTLSVEVDLGVYLAVLVFATATLLGAAAGACLAWLSRGLPHLEDFSRIVRRQLAAGRWALVVHGVPWERQAGSVALLRETGVDWCAVSVVQRTL